MTRSGVKKEYGMKNYIGASYLASFGALGVASCCVLPMTMMLLGLDAVFQVPSANWSSECYLFKDWGWIDETITKPWGQALCTGVHDPCTNMLHSLVPKMPKTFSGLGH